MAVFVRDSLARYYGTGKLGEVYILDKSSMVSRQTGPTRHAYAWQIGPVWQDTLELKDVNSVFAHKPLWPIFQILG